MEYIRIVLLLTVLASLCTGDMNTIEEKDLRLLDNDKRIEKQGCKMQLRCQLDQGLNIILSHTVSWVHMSLANPDHPKETVLTTQQTLMDKASPDDYNIDVQYNTSHCLFVLTVKKIRPQDDGVFICRVTKNNGGTKFEAKAYVIVPNNVERVSMQFDGEDSIEGEVNAVLQREEGIYGVTCTARGFNPYASLRITVDDEEVQTEPTRVDSDIPGSIAARARRYTATATAPELFLKGMHSGSRLKCLAQADFEGARTVMASVPLSVIVVAPEVHCAKNVSARPGDMYVKIKCVVRHENVHIDRYSWEIGVTGEILEPGKQYDTYNEVHVLDKDEHTTEVILDLYEAKDEHFDTVLYLDIFTHSGQAFRTEAELIRLPGPDPSGSSTVSAALVLCMLSAMLATFCNCL